ncbi:hypothetical protein N7499_006783 [Penicillium canescens]|uniref:Uncharacterized protein n=1 Tax=Penicillium canescens TaxID=5083 RepID=A0AAD6N9S6_PENCN|nr:hypothetical protein N7522_008565 [Penicillium canescens]KAJ6044277.1 hypothetical protein N7460_005632 [Penicillium canescens]KAJ6081909.1 hypothetical protein N7499_006783 [Penicillium canescens]KAJ6176296.1 hypothetical protein N7485_003210 [Penicillium canescens]
MATFMRLRGNLQPGTSLLRLNQIISSSVARPTTQIQTQIQNRSYAQKQDKTPPSSQDQASPSPNHPIPSNKARPTLRDGNQSPIADDEGHLKDDLPEDVKRHNEEMEDRYDKPYNHMSDKGSPESKFEN